MNWTKTKLKTEAYAFYFLARGPVGWYYWHWGEDTGEDGCGVGRFKLPPSHPFTPACKWHDMEYELKRFTRKNVDVGFLTRMLAIAEGRDWINA